MKTFKNVDALVEFLGKARRPVLVKISADWCYPCKQLAPVLKSVVEKYEGKLVHVELDASGDDVDLRAIGVRAVPTMIAFRDGAEVDRLVGLAPKREIEEFVSKFLEA